MTISYNKLGSNGRLGNQMFQYASLRGIANYNQYQWMIPPPDYNHKDNYGLFDTFEMKHCKPENLGFNDAMSVTEKTHAFDDSMFYCTDGVNIDGYLQTEDYFVHIADQIREDFTFRKDYLEPCKEYIDSLASSPIFIHIRQSDNIGREEYHPILPLSFFESALEFWSPDTPCFVFTDDLEWCKKQSLFKNDRFIFNDNPERYEYQTIDGTGQMQNTLLPQVDLCLMSLCTGAIIANSSFSWWGAWLQGDRGKVIAPDPEKWYGSAMSHLDTSMMVPARWQIHYWSK
ncbi:glycosyl transferase [Cyanophage S-SSM6a]|nr:glycosyl transferase [Cyanophage S-SSM6a]